MIRRPSDAWPAFLLDEYRHLACLPAPLVQFSAVEGIPTMFKCRPRPGLDSFYFRGCSSGSDYAGLEASVAWLREGPKIATVTEDQWQALSRVEVRLPVCDFHMPFPTLLVNMPPGKMHRFCILHRRDFDYLEGNTTTRLPMLIGESVSHDYTHDIITMVRHYADSTVDDYLDRFSDEVSVEESGAALSCMRVACNYALAMTNFGCQSRYLFPAEVQRERRYIAKGKGERRDKAKARLHEQPMELTLDRSVKLHHREGGHETSAPTGREMPFHWRRGHWRKARVGEGRADTKLTLVRPCMVRADLLTTDPTDTTTCYTR